MTVNTEDGRPKTEDGRRKTEDGRQETGDRSLVTILSISKSLITNKKIKI